MISNFNPLEVYHSKEKRIVASKVVDCASVKYDGEGIGGYLLFTECLIQAMARDKSQQKIVQ